MGKGGIDPPPRGQQPKTSPPEPPAQNQGDSVIPSTTGDSTTINNTEPMGGNGGGGVISGGGPRQNDCLSVDIITTLQSVNKKALAPVSVGNILPVTTHGKSVVVLNNENPRDICGAIGKSSSLLIDCIENQGARFKATVLKKDGGECQVRVQHT